MDDYDDARQCFREALENVGYRFVEAADGQQALDLLMTEASEQFALIILDRQMPVMDGWQLLELPTSLVASCALPAQRAREHGGRLHG